MELGKSIVRSIQYHMPDIGSYLIFVSFNISENLSVTCNLVKIKTMW